MLFDCNIRAESDASPFVKMDGRLVPSLSVKSNLYCSSAVTLAMSANDINVRIIVAKMSACAVRVYWSLQYLYHVSAETCDNRSSNFPGHSYNPNKLSNNNP